MGWPTSPPHLTAPLLALPPDARHECMEFVDFVLWPLVEIRDNDYVVPEIAGEDQTYTRDDFDDVVSDLQMMVALLDDAAGG